MLEGYILDEFRFEPMDQTTEIRIHDYLLERFDLKVDVDYELDFQYITSTIKIKYL